MASSSPLVAILQALLPSLPVKAVVEIAEGILNHPGTRRTLTQDQLDELQRALHRERWGDDNDQTN